MLIAHLLASPFLGGPERQVVGLAEHLPAGCRSLFLSFAEGGKARPFLEHVAGKGYMAIELRENWPRWRRAAKEVAGHLRRHHVDLLCTSGYKPDIIGLVAARQAQIPAAAIAHGWTGATWKVRLNEALDRWVMRRFDCVVSVSESQARKVKWAGVEPARMATIPNAIVIDDFPSPQPENPNELKALFPNPPQIVVAGAGRLSPEKGFDVFVDMAALVAGSHPDVGFIVFGDGPPRNRLKRHIAARGLNDRCILAGFREDLSNLLPQADVLALPSYTEGLPVILLEAMAANVAVAATRVGGVPEVIQDGVHGLLTEPGDAAGLAAAVTRLVTDAALRQKLTTAGQHRVREEFSCTLQSRRYLELFERLIVERSLPNAEGV
jgi:glycosyltransferase involved in cell wall biosynthesis